MTLSEFHGRYVARGWAPQYGLHISANRPGFFLNSLVTDQRPRAARRMALFYSYMSVLPSRGVLNDLSFTLSQYFHPGECSMIWGNFRTRLAVKNRSQMVIARYRCLFPSPICKVDAHHLDQGLGQGLGRGLGPTDVHGYTCTMTLHICTLDAFRCLTECPSVLNDQPAA